MSRTSIATREQRATLVDQLERPFEHVAREGERDLTLVADGYVSVESAGFRMPDHRPLLPRAALELLCDEGSLQRIR
jgi:hypothetical protein